MSTTKPDSKRCKHCNKPYDRYYTPGYCSEDCYHTSEGRSLLNVVRHDHKYCTMCGSQLKEVEEPTDEALRQIDGYHSTTSVVGFQYRTPSADHGEVNAGGAPGRELVRTGTVCGECGNTNSTECFPEMQDRFLLEYAQGLVDAIRDQRKAGVHEETVDQRVFMDALVETGDLELSLGRSIQ